MNDWTWLDQFLQPTQNDWAIILGITQSHISRIIMGERRLSPLAETYFSQALRLATQIPPPPVNPQEKTPGKPLIIWLKESTLELQKMQQMVNEGERKQKLAYNRRAWLRALKSEPNTDSRPLTNLANRWERLADDWLKPENQEKLALLRVKIQVLQYTIALLEEKLEGNKVEKG